MVLLQSGDHRAFSKIYERWAPRLNAFFYRMLWSDANDAEDCVQELFSKIIEKPQLYQTSYTVKPWLFRIASNMCKNIYRKRSFEKEYLNQLEKQGIELPQVENQIDTEIANDRLNMILNSLDEDKHLLFVLRHQQDLSIGELASLFDLPEGTIKSRLFHIKQLLIKKMSETSKIDCHGD